MDEPEGGDLKYCGGEAKGAGAGGGKALGRYRVPSVLLCVSPGVHPHVCVGERKNCRATGMELLSTAGKTEAAR